MKVLRAVLLIAVCAAAVSALPAARSNVIRSRTRALAQSTASVSVPGRSVDNCVSCIFILDLWRAGVDHWFSEGKKFCKGAPTAAKSDCKDIHSALKGTHGTNNPTAVGWASRSVCNTAGYCPIVPQGTNGGTSNAQTEEAIAIGLVTRRSAYFKSDDIRHASHKKAALVVAANTVTANTRSQSINFFKPSGTNNNEHALLQALAAHNPTWKNGWQTATSNGMPLQVGNVRDKIEQAMFGAEHFTNDVAHDAIVSAARPVYTALNLGKCKSGAAPSYGFAALHLTQAVKARSTFFWGDTVQQNPKTPEKLITVIATPESTINSALSGTLDPFALLFSDATILQHGEAASSPMYMEGHVFGPLTLTPTDVDHVSIDINQIFGTAAGDLLEAAIRALNLDVSWTLSCTQEVRFSTAALGTAAPLVRTQYTALMTTAGQERTATTFNALTTFQTLANFKNTNHL